MAHPDITPGYAWCEECNGLGGYCDGDDDCDVEDIECPRCHGRGEYPLSDNNCDEGEG